MRAIDADKIVYQWQIDADGQVHDGVTLQSIIDKMPTIEPERKKGKWIPQDHNKKNGMITTMVYYCPTCSVCGKTGGYDMSFCPNCGADMRGNPDE